MSPYVLRFAAAVLAASLFVGCGKKEEAPETPAAEESVASAEPNLIDQMLEEKKRDREKELEKTDPAQAAIERLEAKGDEKSKAMAEHMRAQVELQKLMRDPQATDAQKKAATERMLVAARNTGRRDHSVEQPPLTLPPDWAATHREEKNAKEAELLVQVGDIDNLGFGWPDGFDPFSGKSTPRHRYPWKPEADDPSGTDTVMVNSGASVIVRNGDGYTRDTYRPDNLPKPLVIEFDPAGVPIKAAVLQLFVDDFQAPVMKTRFSVTLDGQPAPDVEATINKLNQTGPIGKLVTVKLLPEYLGLLADGKLTIMMDDAESNIGDGFAFDFVRLLINPKGFTYSGRIVGNVVDKDSGNPIDGALVSAANVQKATTGKDGKFELKDVPAGLVITTGSHPDYVQGSEQKDLEAGQTVEITLRLERVKDDLAERLENDGKVDLYGIYFDTDKATLKAESAATLNQVLALLRGKPELRLAIAGHTDSQASDSYNLDLSKRRAQSVVKWLTDKGIAPDRLEAQGFGETQPVADNETSAGRALNRRVEIRDLTRQGRE